MEDLNIRTRVTHSCSKNAWNVVGTVLGGDYKIARVPYFTHNLKDFNDKISDELKAANAREKDKAKLRADFISDCFNNSDTIAPKIKC